jgi:peptide/nickel transport system substrate-binding protein
VNVRKSIIAAIAAAVLLSVSACGGSTSAGESSGGATSGGTLTLATITPPKSFAVGEMASSGPENHYYQAVYDTLLGLDKDGKPAADLATDWAYDSTNTKLSLTLRSDVKFTDGTPFDAAAVKANLEKAKQASGEAGSALKAVDSVTVVDPTHADIVLTAPDPSLVDTLARSSGYMASPKALGNADLATNPIGSGPYTLNQSTSTAGSDYVFDRNPDYWNKAAYPYDSVEIKYLDDNTAILNGMRSGQIQGAPGSSSDMLSGAKQAGLTATTFPTGGIVGVWLWDRGGSNTAALADPKVRQAINYAFDRKTIVDTLEGGLGTPTDQIFGANTIAYVPALEDSYSYDVDKAKALMADAGYATGFSMTLPDFSPVFPKEQAAMTEALAALNISVTYSPITGDQVVGSIMGGQWPINFFSLTAASPWEMSALTLTPQSPFNPFHTDDSTVTGLLDKAKAAAPADQGPILQELNTYLVENAWFAPWYSQLGSYITTTNVAVQPAVPGVGVPPLSSFAPAGN